MKFIAILAIVLVANAVCAQDQKFNPLPFLDNAKDFYIGFSLALGAVASIPDAFPCLQEVSNTEDLFKNIITDFKTTKIFDALRLIGQIPNQFDQVYDSCGSMVKEGQDWEKSVVTQFKAVVKSQGYKNLLDNYYTVVDDMEAAYNAFQAGDDFTAGAQCGNLLYIFLYGKPPGSSTLNKQ